MKHISTIILSLIFFSCFQKQPTVRSVDVRHGDIIHTDSVVTIKVDVPEIEPFKIDDKLSDVRYIPLETNPKSLIGEITKVIFYKDNFYVLDAEITNSIYIFDKDGKYINKISREGKGPGEYNQISDFGIDVFNNQILIYTDSPIKIIRNTITGNFISEIHPPCFAVHFTPMPNKSYAIYLDYAMNDLFLKKEYNLLFIDSTATIQSGVIEYDHSRISDYFYKPLSVFYNYNNATYFYPALNDTVYRVGINKITPVYSFDFGENAFDKKILQKDIAEQDKYFKNQLQTYASFFYIFETDKVLFYFFCCKSALYRGYYSKQTGQQIIGALCMNKKFKLGRPVGGNDKMLIEQLSPLALSGYKTNIEKLSPELDDQLLNIIKNYEESDNPVLVTYDMNF